MDRVKEGSKQAAVAKPFAWLPSAMPGVTKLWREKRAKFGGAHMAECWERGVVQGQPGWMFAREGTLAIGTPWEGDPVMANFAAAQVTSTQALLIIREP